jgi:hypothetical protein
MYKLSAMKPGLAGIIDKVCIWRIFESTETDFCIAANASSIDYTNTWLWKRVHWLSQSKSPFWSTTEYGCEDKLEFTNRVASVSLLSMRIYLQVAQVSKIQPIQATLHNTRWIDSSQVHYGSPKAIPKLDPVDVTRHLVTLHHLLTVYNDMFDQMDGVMRAVAKKKTQWKEDLYFALTVARQKLSK